MHPPTTTLATQYTKQTFLSFYYPCNYGNKHKQCPLSLLPTDKQQELDLPTVKVDHPDAGKGEKASEKTRPMCQISGLRKLKHANSFTGMVPQYGVDTPHKDKLGEVRHHHNKCLRFLEHNYVVSV